MNSKAEWGSFRLPRLTLEVGEAVQQEDFRGAKQGRRPIARQGAKHLPPNPSEVKDDDVPPLATPTPSQDLTPSLPAPTSHSSLQGEPGAKDLHSIHQGVPRGKRKRRQAEDEDDDHDDDEGDDEEPARSQPKVLRPDSRSDSTLQCSKVMKKVPLPGSSPGPLCPSTEELQCPPSVHCPTVHRPSPLLGWLSRHQGPAQ